MPVSLSFLRDMAPNWDEGGCRTQRWRAVPESIQEKKERKWQWILKHDVLHHLSLYPHHSFCFCFLRGPKVILGTMKICQIWSFGCMSAPSSYLLGHNTVSAFLFRSAIGVSKDKQLCYHPRLTCASRLQDLHSLIHKRSRLHMWLSTGRGVFAYLKSLLSHKISTCAAIFSLVSVSLPRPLGICTAA